jgi:hypothetical protein
MSILKTLKSKLFGQPKAITRDELQALADDDELWTDETTAPQQPIKQELFSDAQRALFAEIESFRKGQQ